MSLFAGDRIRTLFPVDRLNRYLALFVVFFAFLYTALRAYSLSVFHDEANTYFFSKLPYWQIFTYQGVSSNSHLLNTVLIKTFTTWFGCGEFVLRLPALLGHVLYLTAGYHILRRFFRREMILPGVLWLNLNPFLLELFSAGRGYALALGFMAWGTYYFLWSVRDWTDAESPRRQVLSTWFLAFAVLSQLAFLNICLAMLAVFVCLGLWRALRKAEGQPRGRAAWWNFRVHVGALLLPHFVLGAVYALPLLRMGKQKDFNFWYGGVHGFWSDTVTSLIEATLYGEVYLQGNAALMIGAVVAVLLSVSLLVVFHQLFTERRMDKTARCLFGLLALLGVTAGGIVFQWTFFKVRYVVDRTAIYFLPLFMLLALFLWDRLAGLKIKILAGVINIVFVLSVGLAAGHFYRCANYYWNYLCPYDVSTKAAMKYLADFSQGKGFAPRSRTLGTHWIFKPSISYYRERYALLWLNPPRDVREGPSDFYFLTAESDFQKNYGLTKDWRKMSQYSLKVIKKFPATKSFFALPKGTSSLF